MYLYYFKYVRLVFKVYVICLEMCVIILFCGNWMEEGKREIRFN